MKILLLNQTFYPDTVSTAQHLTDLALDLKERGHEVTVFAGGHGYDDPSQTYPSKEEHRGVRIRRVGYTRFGKKSKIGRAVDFATFLLNLFFRLLLVPRQDRVVALTSPPLVAFFGALHCYLKGGKLVQWVMDLNPDEAVAAGWLKESSLTARFLKSVSRWTFRSCEKIIVLDRFMKARLMRNYGVLEAKIAVIPPWAHDEEIRPLSHERNSFRKEQGLAGKFVVMYSGNHSPCHPLDTVLQAALRFKEDPEVFFYFIGGGSLTGRVREYARSNALKNIVQLPYQPLQRLSESLSAGDLHLVVMGDAFPGILHPCKIYGILAVGRPFIFIGPEESHLGDLMLKEKFGCRISHGDVEGLIEAIRSFRRIGPQELEETAKREIACKDREFGQRVLVPKMIREITQSEKTHAYS